MAMIKCTECRKDISSSANVCPNCGKARTQTSGCAMIAAIVIGACVLFSIIANFNGNRIAEERSQSEQTRLAALTPMQLEKQQAQAAKAAADAAEKERISDEQFHRALRGATILKKSARDPESFVLIRALAIDSKPSVCYDYRARNGFGGYSTEKAVQASKNGAIKTSSEDGFTQIWNRECGGLTGTDETSLVTYAMKSATD